MPTPPDPSRRSTPRGFLTLSGGIATALGGALVGVGGWGFGLGELTGLGIAVLLVVLAGVVGVRLRRPRIRCVRTVEPGRIFAGDVVQLTWTTTRTGPGTGASLELSDRLVESDGRSRSDSTVVPASGPGQTHRASRRVRVHRRGVGRIGPAVLRLTDPFGVAVRHLPGPGPVTFTVLPRITEVPPPLALGSDDPSGSDVAGTTGTEFATIREYVPGDDLRRVHWRTSARRDELMVRRDQTPRRPGCTVVLDVHVPPGRAETFERAVAAAASVLVAAAGAALRIRLVTTAGIDTGGATGPAHLDLILHTLARVDPAARTGALAVPGPDPAILFSVNPPGEPIPADLALAVRFGDDRVVHPHPRTLVVRETDTFERVWRAHLGSIGATGPAGGPGAYR